MRINRLSFEARILYSCFCVFLLIGYATAVWFYIDDALGVTPGPVKQYYLGPDAGVPDPVSVSGSSGDDGPALDLPDEHSSTAAAAGLHFKKSPRQLMETFHFHLFSVPIVLLILAHIFMMCGLRTQAKVGVIVLSHVATFVHLVVPPLVGFGSDGFAFLMFPSAVIMTITWVYMTAWPVWEMWRPIQTGDATGQESRPREAVPTDAGI